MTRLRRLVDDVVWGPETGARLLVVHTGLSILIGVRIVFGPYRALAETPPGLFDPVPILAWLDRMPAVGVVVALQVVGGLAALAAALRRHPRVAFAVAWGCYLVLAGLRGSRGKVLHNDLLLLWASAAFLLAPLALTWHDRTPRRENGWPIRVAMTVTALVYFLAGYHKLRRSGIDWAIGDNVRYMMLWGPSIGRARWEGLARWVGENLWAARATGTFILGLELTFPVALVVRGLRPLYVVAAVFLHVTTWFVLGLDYWAWAATVPLLFVDWPALLASRRTRDAFITPA
ncbi:MAG: hypothetical protein ACRD0U_06940 [Acidimicrobiales bacterium]